MGEIKKGWELVGQQSIVIIGLLPMFSSLFYKGTYDVR